MRKKWGRGTAVSECFVGLRERFLRSNPCYREENGGKIISLHLYINTELEMQLMSYGKWIKVLAPPELRQTMKDNVKFMSGYYNVSDNE